MPQTYSLQRNTTEGFARRVRKNLDFIIKKRCEKEDVHEVTQLAISLLGLIVFPWEAKALRHLESIPLTELEAEGWPRWKILLDEKCDTKSLGDLTRHLRNAACHRRLNFSSDHPEMHLVEIEFEDAARKKSSPYWRAKICAADLREFCDRFTKRLEDLVG
jgi:hypothetical protein